MEQSHQRRSLCSAVLVLALAPVALSGLEAWGQPTNATAETMADFTGRVQAYVALHRKVAATLPTLSDEATPQEIDRHQREFATRMIAARAGATQGHVFTPPMQIVVRRLIGQLFADAASRRQLRDSVTDDNPPPAQVRLAVNARYPDTVPLSTMPPQILRNLPALPKEVEYRFVGDHLILLDPDAHIVVDFVARVLPR